MNELAQLKRKFKEFEGEDDKIIPDEKQLGYMDETNVSMFVPKTKRLKKIFENTFDVDPKEVVDTLTSTDSRTAKYGVDYLIFLLELLKKSKCESVKLTLDRDYPLIAETEDFKFILAPRINGGN